MIRPREIARGIELFPARTPTLPPATHTNSYALGAGEVLLIEPATPYDDERREWLQWAAAMKATGRTLVGILATHHHVDHVSGAGFFARALDVPVFAHRRTLDRIADELLDVRAIAIDEGHRFVLGGATERAWTTLHTPGHAPGHVVLHDAESKTIVAGDMVANGSTIIIPPDDGGDMSDYLAQLRRLDALGASTMLPAHGEPIDDPHALLGHYIAHRLAREAKVYAAHQRLLGELGRAPTATEMVPLAYDDTEMALWPLAAVSLEAHLVKLRRDGRI